MKQHSAEMSSANTCTKKRRELVFVHITLYDVVFLKTCKYCETKNSIFNKKKLNSLVLRV